jgi:hypothetical protein
MQQWFRISIRLHSTWRNIVRTKTEPANYTKFIDAIVAGKNGDPSFRRAADLQKILDACYSKSQAVKF